MVQADRTRRQRKDLDWRENVILDLVLNNPNAHHNKLQRIVEGQMSKRTFAKKTGGLIKDNFLLSTTNKKKKYYLLPGSEIYTVAEFESNARKLRAILRGELSSLQRRYSKLSPSRRIQEVTRICEIILRQQRNLFILSYLFPLHEEHHEMLEEEYAQFFKIVLNIVESGPAGKRMCEMVYDRLLDPAGFLFNPLQIN